MIVFLLNEDIIGFNVTMHYLSLGDKLQSSCQLIRNLQCLFLLQRAAFGHDVLEVPIGAKFKYHGHVVFGEEAVEDLSGEEIVNVRDLGELFQHGHLAVCC